MTEEQVRILKLHKRWADRYTLSWLGFAVLLLTGFQFVLDRAGIEAADRTMVMLLLALIVLVAAIWQAIGLGIARVHMVVRGINLER
jgi:cation transport ATPase